MNLELLERDEREGRIDIYRESEIEAIEEQGLEYFRNRLTEAHRDVEHGLAEAVGQKHRAGGQAAGGEPNTLMSFLPLIIIFVIFYFLLIRPQQKRAKEHKAMVEALSKGDEVVSQGGLLGKVTKVGDSFVTLEVADGTVAVDQRAVTRDLEEFGHPVGIEVFGQPFATPGCGH